MRKRKFSPTPQPLRFSPYAWAKLIYLRDRGSTEIGGFAVCHSDDLLRVDDIQLVKQRCTCVTVEFDDASVADYVDRQVDAGRSLQQCFRVWVHTHPGESAMPSSVDEETFARVFQRSNWALMFILAREGECYARLQFNVGPAGCVELQVEIDYSLPFAGSDVDAWEAEYLQSVRVPQHFDELALQPLRADPFDPPGAWRDAWDDYLDLDFAERCAYEF